MQKKAKRSALLTAEENGTVKETVRKSKLSASNEFEYKKLTRAQEGLLNCSMEEEKESLVMTYEVKNLLPWAQIRREKKELVFAALIDAGKLAQRAQMYCFTLAPENLYYDIQGRVYVKTRDVYLSLIHI